MNSINKIWLVIFSFLIISSCNNKKSDQIIKKHNSKDYGISKYKKNEEFIGGYYETITDNNNDCSVSISIMELKTGYFYILQTKSRNISGKVRFSTNESGEKYLVLEGIKWDEYKGEISDEEETDSISDSKTAPKELEIPVGIDASYVKDTLTIQNYGNSMNSYTKISECGRKYIQLIRK
ncbi:hypothetical protein IRZ71_12365 [Flavobacterium sp. ANB]|uniref:hypothetical protein n=1 Tax=unclassified Flavobacterium TaxID=196869 RepID=UPI0012B6CCC1|nr:MULTISPECIES: hypothetical protein [unclassified Flavobacterium]MBF4517148.1 hypothetical protein [Flavobacterium sp. ANB]MTD71884.1 hypothetical protein [Flavobacterium sp. LC2016-13]